MGNIRFSSWLGRTTCHIDKLVIDFDYIEVDVNKRSVDVCLIGDTNGLRIARATFLLTPYLYSDDRDTLKKLITAAKAFKAKGNALNIKKTHFWRDYNKEVA